MKTRLAKSVGDEKALEIYKSLLAHTRQTVLQVDVSRLLFYADKINPDDDWSQENFLKYAQVNAGLGERMHQAFVEALEHHSKAVIVGSDIPGINPVILEQAFQQLDDHDFVIGPAMDGGYYLLGMKSPSRELFENMAWSTEKVFEQTTKRMREKGKSWHELPVLSDVDYLEDWEKYGWDL